MGANGSERVPLFCGLRSTLDRTECELSSSLLVFRNGYHATEARLRVQPEPDSEGIGALIFEYHLLAIHDICAAARAICQFENAEHGRRSCRTTMLPARPRVEFRSSGTDLPGSPADKDVYLLRTRQDWDAGSLSRRLTRSPEPRHNTRRRNNILRLILRDSRKLSQHRDCST